MVIKARKNCDDFPEPGFGASPKIAYPPPETDQNGHFLTIKSEGLIV